MTDPPVPVDGSCIVCGADRVTKPLKPLYAQALETDPFCRTECARKWYGVPLPGPKRPDPRGYLSSLPPAA